MLLIVFTTDEITCSWLTLKQPHHYNLSKCADFGWDRSHKTVHIQQNVALAYQVLFQNKFKYKKINIICLKTKLEIISE